MRTISEQLVRPAAAGASATAGRIPALDGIRAIAFFIVLLFHIRASLPHGLLPFRIVANLATFGWSGVDLFFVLSGFLITGILLQTKDARNFFSSFYARRVLRIFPLYYLVLTLLFLSRSFWENIGKPLPPHLWPQFLYVNNWTDVHLPASQLQVTGHLWSLAIEEQFYLVWPLCVWMIPTKSLWKVCVSGIVFALGLRCWQVCSYGPSDFVYKALFTRMDSLLVGGLTALLVLRSEWMRKGSAYFLPTGLALVTAVIILTRFLHEQPLLNGGRFVQSFGFTLLALGYGLFILWACAGTGALLLRRALCLRPVRHTGAISYGLYVYHIPVLQLLDYAFNGLGLLASLSALRGPAFLSLEVVLTFLLAEASYRGFELRFLKLKRLFRPGVPFRYALPGLRAVQ